MQKDSFSHPLPQRLHADFHRYVVAVLETVHNRPVHICDARRVTGETSALVTSSTQICALREGPFEEPSGMARKVQSPPDGMAPSGTPWPSSLGCLEACLDHSVAAGNQGLSSLWGRILDR